MREFLTSGQVGNIELNEQKRIRQEINKRWDALGMTEGLKGVVKENIATLFENQAKALLSEATASPPRASSIVFPPKSRSEVTGSIKNKRPTGRFIA